MQFALFEDVLNADQKSSYLFTQVVTTISAYTVVELQQAFIELEKYRVRGFYLAGYIAYDAIFYMETKLQKIHVTKNNKVPLLYFVVYQKMESFSSSTLLDVLASHSLPVTNNMPAQINFLQSELDFTDYQQQFLQVQEHLRAGDSYQLNLTLRLKIELTNFENLFAFYYQLSRYNPVSYAAFLPWGSKPIISLSPELFFKKNAEQILVRPMKGTAARSNNHKEDQDNYSWLSHDEKNLAENLIIVDLLRNDLAKFAKTASVKTDKLFSVEKYASVYQMVSEISAKLASNTKFSCLIKDLFPSGSISGAPKLRTMQLIEDIEASARGLYTGSIGFILPNNDMVFNVAIRTLYQEDANFLNAGVGGGITIKSKVEEEWQEIKTKIKFMTQFYRPEFSLVESLLYKDGLLVNLDAHLQRLKSSAEKLFFDYDEQKCQTKLNKYLKQHFSLASAKHKLRLELSSSGELKIEHQPIFAAPAKLRVKLLNQPLDSSHPLFLHKTTAKVSRGLYTQLYQEHLTSEFDELIFINQERIITESRFYNVIILYRGKLITSPIKYGLLGGVFRQQLLAQQQISEVAISELMFAKAEAIYLCNDVRGLIKCEYLGKIC